MSKSSSDRGGGQGFSPVEEEFFRAGDAISAAAAEERGANLDAAPARAGLWSRLFKRVPRPVTEQPVPAEPAARRRAPTEPLVADDDRDWQIAIARVRHPTNA